MLGANQLIEVLIGAEAASSETLTSFGTAIGWARPPRGRSALEALGRNRFHDRAGLRRRWHCRRRRRRGGSSDSHRASVDGPCLLLTDRYGSHRADGDQAARDCAAMSNLTRWCLIDSTVTPPIGPRRSPKRDVPFERAGPTDVIRLHRIRVTFVGVDRLALHAPSKRSLPHVVHTAEFMHNTGRMQAPANPTVGSLT